MSYLPAWYNSSEIDYEQYGVSYYLLFTSLLIMELGFLSNAMLFIAAGILLVISLFLSIKMILSSYMWANGVSFSMASKYAIALKALLVFISINIVLISSGFEFPMMINMLSIMTVLMLSIITFMLFKGRRLTYRSAIGNC